MRNKIINARNMQDIPQGYLPNLILIWSELGIVDQVQSFSQESSFLLATLYSHLEECQ